MKRTLIVVDLRHDFYQDLSHLDPDIKRIFIKDPYRFLRCAAKYKNHLEF